MRFLVLICLLTITVACSNQDMRVISSSPKEPTCEELRIAMRFHGVLVAKQDENHEWYFIRDGKRCPLFTNLKKQKNQHPQAPQTTS